MAADTELLQWIWKRFGNRNHHGFLVDVGAGDGVDGSLSRRLLTEAHWSGVLVEPLPISFSKLRLNYHDRSDVVLINCAASDYCRQGELFPCGGVSTLEPTWAMACEQWWDHVIYGDPIPIELKTLDSILDKNHVSHIIDLLKIDTEGHDLKVLNGMGWDRQVEVVIVETLDMLVRPVDGLWQPSPEIVEFLLERGFKHVLTTTGGNAAFVNLETIK